VQRTEAVARGGGNTIRRIRKMTDTNGEVTEEPSGTDDTSGTDAPPDGGPVEGRGGADGKSKALGAAGLGDRGRTKVNEASDE
jgi:hypothetical protein